MIYLAFSLNYYFFYIFGKPDWWTNLENQLSKE